MKLWIAMMLAVSSLLFAENFVTYEFSGGRLGDCLLTYLHAKWLSHKYHLPLLYKPFLYSEQLMLDAEELSYDTYRHLRTIRITSGQANLTRSWPGISCVYVCPYFPEDPAYLRTHPYAFHFDIDPKDREFKIVARSLIAPKAPLALTIPPQDKVSVAIHVREGGGYDTDHTRLFDPLKLPPLEFYIDGLREVARRFSGYPIYCYLFTDAIEPHLLARELAKAAPNLEIDFRKENNHHTQNVLEDFFSLFAFDVLIRPQSNYSIVPSLIHDYALLYAPMDFKREGRKITITKTELKVDEEKLQQVKQRVSGPFGLTPREKPLSLTTSILVPCHPKHAPLLFALLDAYAQQTVLPDEVIISISEVDKVSDALLAPLAQNRWPFRVRLVTSPLRLGDGGNRNRAAHCASGDILMAQDADDVPHPQRVEIIKSCFERYEILHLVHGYIYALQAEFPSIQMPHLVAYGPETDMTSLSFPFANGPVAIRREVFEQVQWPEGFSRDNDSVFNRKVHEQFPRLLVVQDPLYLYRAALSAWE
ncbi:MAG: glycosyltransferase [Chlamydiia bacterium]|nr:glycosyltransferase [Chlamydiia bacterium]